MPRWSEYDTDEERLPEGMQRIGYDADTQVYTFRDAEGRIWESAPGNRYGRLHPIGGSGGSRSSSPSQSLMHSSEPEDAAGYRKASWRQEMMPLLNWFLLVGVFLLVILWFITRGSSGSASDDEVVRNCGAEAMPYKIRAGDTCWAIAEEKSVPLDVLLENNEGLNCDKLAVGETICVPTV
jgi:LysM repeat protein